MLWNVSLIQSEIKKVNGNGKILSVLNVYFQVSIFESSVTRSSHLTFTSDSVRKASTYYNVLSLVFEQQEKSVRCKEIKEASHGSPSGSFDYEWQVSVNKETQGKAFSSFVAFFLLLHFFLPPHFFPILFPLLLPFSFIILEEGIHFTALFC